MRRILASFASAVVVFCAASANAQSISGIDLKVPFRFEAAGTIFEPGDVELRLKGDRLSLRSKKATASVLPEQLRLPPRQFAKQTKLIFSRYEDQYFLSEVWFVGTRAGWRLPKSHAEEEAEKSGTERREVVLAVKQ